MYYIKVLDLENNIIGLQSSSMPFIPNEEIPFIEIEAEEFFTLQQKLLEERAKRIEAQQIDRLVKPGQPIEVNEEEEDEEEQIDDLFNKNGGKE